MKTVVFRAIYEIYIFMVIIFSKQIKFNVFQIRSN